MTATPLELVPLPELLVLVLLPLELELPEPLLVLLELVLPELLLLVLLLELLATLLLLAPTGGVELAGELPPPPHALRANTANIEIVPIAGQRNVCIIEFDPVLADLRG